MNLPASREYEHQQEGDARNPHEGLDFAGTTDDDHDDDIRHEAETDAIGNRVRERDSGDDGKRRERMLEPAPIDLANRGHHKAPHHRERPARRRP